MTALRKDHAPLIVAALTLVLLPFVLDLCGLPLRSAIFCWTVIAQVTASTALENSTSMPSPVVLTMRPLCSAMAGSTISRREAFNAASVPTSSAPVSRE